MTETYLDYNATAPMRPGTVEVMAEALRAGGNPSSPHQHGQRARQRLASARERIANLLNRPAAELVFTSGATEANAFARNAFKTCLLSAIEHPSMGTAEADLPMIPVGEAGCVDLGELERLLYLHQPELVSVMAANNETGIVQPIAEVAALVHANGARLLVDAAQSFGKLDPGGLQDADLLTLSAHKLGGPPGVGAVVVMPDCPLVPLFRGGGQEGRRRAGTENVAGAVGFADATEAAVDWPAVRALRNTLESAVLEICPEAIVIGREANRLPNTSCIITPGVTSEAQLMAMDLAGIRVGTGAACSSGRVEPSHVLRAMNVPDDLARCAMRVSLGWASTAQDVEAFLLCYKSMMRRVRQRHEGCAPARPP